MSPAYHYARKLPGMATALVPIDRVKATETWLAAVAREHPVISTERVGHASGNGLGLAIVRAIAGGHGATLTANARPEGGLDIQASFPLSPAKVPTAEHEPSASR